MAILGIDECIVCYYTQKIRVVKIVYLIDNDNFGVTHTLAGTERSYLETSMFF